MHNVACDLGLLPKFVVCNVRHALFKGTNVAGLRRTEHLTRIIHLLTAWSRGLLEKLTVSQPVKKFPAFCGTRARPLSLS
jgi:hypothetical protein